MGEIVRVDPGGEGDVVARWVYVPFRGSPTKMVIDVMRGGYVRISVCMVLSGVPVHVYEAGDLDGIIEVLREAKEMVWGGDG